MRIPMSESVTEPRLMIMTSIVSEESLARDRHTDTQTKFGLVYLKLFFKVAKDFVKTNNKKHTTIVPLTLV